VLAFACGVGVLLVACGPAPGSVADPRAGLDLLPCGGGGPESLDIALVGPAASPALGASICDWFRDEDWRVRFVVVDDVPPAQRPATGTRTGFVAVALASEHEARLYVDLPGLTPALASARWVRAVPLGAGLDDAGIEVIAQALHSTAQAAEAAAPPEPEASAAPEPPPAPLPTPAPPPAPDATSHVADTEGAARSRLAVYTGIGYHFHARGGEPPTHGPLLRFELDWAQSAIVIGNFVNAAVFTSGRSRAPGLDLGLRGASFGAGFAGRLSSGAWAARAGLGGSLELLTVDAHVDDADALRLRVDSRPRLRSYPTTEAGLAWRTGKIEFSLLGLLRWQLSATHYDVLDGEALSTVLRAWRLQPGAELGASYAW